jgi:acyl dehydratase
MAINLGSVGQRFVMAPARYGVRDVALYALALGAGTDDLAYLLEDPPPKVLPTYAVVPAVAPVFAALDVIAAGVAPVHMAHRTELLSPFPAQGELATEAVIRALWDMGGLGAVACIDTETRVGDIVCGRTTWHILLRGGGGFGGERPPPSLRTRPPDGAKPDFELAIPTRPEQSLLYRLMGDLNLVHARPEDARAAGFERPILHGLCTYGIAARAALRELAGDQPERFRALEVRFAKPVYPGETLIVRGYRLGESGQAALTVDLRERNEQVIANALFEYAA